MTTPEARPAAPIEEHESREPRDDPDWTIAASTKWRNRVRRAVGNQAAPIPRGQLWQREAARDVQAHGEPRPVDALRLIARGGTVEALASFPGEARRYIADGIERRRPAMRATRAELDALRGAGPKPYRCEVCEEHGIDECPAPPPPRLEPEPSSMARTVLALGLAFTSDERGER